MTDPTAITTGSDKFAAFATYYPDCALVQVYARPTKHEIDFSRAVVEYETARKGATTSARREVRRLEGLAE